MYAHMTNLNQNKTASRRIFCRCIFTILIGSFTLLSSIVSGDSSSVGNRMNRALRFHPPCSSSWMNIVTKSISSSSSMGAFVSSPTINDVPKRTFYTKTNVPFHHLLQQQQQQKQQCPQSLSSKVQLRQSSPQHTDASSSTGYARPLVNWYPGHIAKAERLLSETLKSVDVIIEVRDARAPKATAHPRVAEWTAGRPRVVVLTHVDMVPKKSFNMWKASYNVWGAGRWDGMVDKQVRNQALQNLQEREKYAEDVDGEGEGKKVQRNENRREEERNSSVDVTSRVEDVLFLDAKRGTGIHALHRSIYKAGSHVNERRLRRGLNERPLRVGVIGYPNVGKSALINKILGRKRARSANTPGITRSLQWIRVRTDINTSSKQNTGKSKREFELLDSPGIIPSHMIDQSDAFLLAACNSIGDAAYDNQIIAGYLCEWVKTLHLMGKGDVTAPQWRNKCLHRYGFDPLEPYKYNVYPTNKSIKSFSNKNKQANNDQKEEEEKRIMSGEDMLYRVADECCKGDVENAARKILQDYRSGRWGPVSLQLAPESEDDDGQAKVSIMSSILNDGVASLEEEERLRVEMEEREQRAKAAMEMAKERGLELPPLMEKKQEEEEGGSEEMETGKDGNESSSSSSSSVPAGEIGKGLFDGW